GMDPLYMIRVFKKSVGVSPHSYQIQKRVAHVQQLLRAGMGIADAAFCAGFFDQSHMARAFRKVVGVTPGRFKDCG
ncbi:MAG: helix-turn-helix transcriptional regulator, partial [Pseudomonas sp.]